MLLAIRPSDEHVRELMDEVLAQPRFARWREIDVEAFERFLQWFADYLTWTATLEADSPLLYWLFLGSLFCVALALLAHIAWSVRTALAFEGPADPVTQGAAAPRWAEEADQLARSGRFLEGSHRLLLGSIDVLVRRGDINLARSDANRVLRERVRRSALPKPVSARFLGLLDRFEQRWFRDRVEDADLYEAWRDLHAQLRDHRA